LYLFVNNEGGIREPLRNPYFNQDAEELLMQGLYRRAIQESSEENLRVYIEWAEKHIKARPIELYFLFLISSYQFVNEPIKACQQYEIASKIYPNSTNVSTYRQYCDKLTSNVTK
jgi:hypothetical protein